MTRQAQACQPNKASKTNPLAAYNTHHNNLTNANQGTKTTKTTQVDTGIQAIKNEAKPQMRRTRSSSGTLENKERKQADQRQRDRKAAQPQKEYHTTRKRYKQTINTDLARPHSRKINSQNRKLHQRENISLYIVTDKPRRQHPAYNKEGKQKEERKKIMEENRRTKGKKGQNEDQRSN